MLTFNELAANLAELTGCSSADAENFLRELFALASDEIETEGVVDIPCLGRFALMEGDVIFKPDTELAEAINAPFADFEPVEVPDGFSLEEPTQPTVESEQSEQSEQSENSELSENSEESGTSEVSEQPEPSEPYEPSEVAETAEPEKRRGISWWWVLLTAILFLGAGFFLGQKWSFTAEEPSSEIPETSEPLETSEVVIEEPVQEPEVIPETVVVLDTVSPGHFLTTMARAHYNQFEYWVYIYEANASRLGNPDKLETGTVVVIPPADSLGLKAGDPEKINEALLKAKEIYSRFN